MNQPIIHELKTEKRFYQKVVSGEKRFEARLDDREPRFAVGHFLLLKEIDNSGNETGWTIKMEITFVLRDSKYGVREGFAILGIKPAEA